MSDEAALKDNDANCMRRAAEGDSSAFECILERHEGAVLRYLRTIERDEALVEDALQEAFLSAWRAAGSFRGDESARPWLLSIARNAAYRQRRRRAGEPREHVPLELLGQQAGWGRDDGGALLRRLESREQLAQALHRLEDGDREILLLRDIEGFSGNEVAEMLNLTLPAAKSRLHRARLRLVAALRGRSNAHA